MSHYYAKFKENSCVGTDASTPFENLVLYFSEKVQEIAAFAVPFWFSATKQPFENGFGFPQWSEIPTLPTSLKIKRHFSTAVAFGNSVFF